MYGKLIIVGNLGNDPEIKFTPEGKVVVTMSVASNRKYKDTEQVTWFRVTVWDKQAEACAKWLKKGSQVLVEGRLVPDENGGPRVYERKDGTWGASYEVTAETVRFLGGIREDEEAW